MLENMVSDLLADFTTEDGTLLDSAKATRFLKNSLPLVCCDIDQQFVIESVDEVDTVVPEPSALITQIWYIKAKLIAIEYMITNSAGNVSWKSGDKSMDSQNEALRWERLQKSLLASYKTSVKAINPDFDNPDVVSATMVTGSAERGANA